MTESRSGRSPQRGKKPGEAVSDMKGELWELDAAFLMNMKQMQPGWFGGNLPEEVLEELKNTGRFSANGFQLTAQPGGKGKIMLQLKQL